ncbi:hypothetical protein BD560DRAFT_427174 [Blakeslea trispora]|nr:hypothetical protein BD560DRAFT_427174 [Blakeslea trispora]
MQYLKKIEKPDKFVTKHQKKIQGFFSTFRLTEVEVASPYDHLLQKTINSEVTDFLIILVKNFVFALALKEKQLTGNGKIGSKKAARLILAIKNITTNAKMVIEFLNEHLLENCSKEEQKNIVLIVCKQLSINS